MMGHIDSDCAAPGSRGLGLFKRNRDQVLRCLEISSQHHAGKRGPEAEDQDEPETATMTTTVNIAGFSNR